MRMKDVMTSKVTTVSLRATADYAWQVMRAGGVHHLVVTDGKQIVGVISDRDLGGGPAVRRAKLVSEVMAAPVIVAPETTVRDAATLLRGRPSSCVPVVANGRLVGLVTADRVDGVSRRRTPAARARRR
jgi:acetoin utilization protein AcuB